MPISASSAERSKAKMKSEKSVCPEVLPDNEVRETNRRLYVATIATGADPLSEKAQSGLTGVTRPNNNNVDLLEV